MMDNDQTESKAVTLTECRELASRALHETSRPTMNESEKVDLLRNSLGMLLLANEKLGFFGGLTLEMCSTWQQMAKASDLRQDTLVASRAQACHQMAFRDEVEFCSRITNTVRRDRMESAGVDPDDQEAVVQYQHDLFTQNQNG